MSNIKLFALGDTRDYGLEVASKLDMKLSEHTEFCFDDGECYCASLENVRGSDVFVICSLYTNETESVSDKLVSLFVFLGSLHDASVEQVTLVMLYHPFSRQDRKCQSRAPVTTKYMSRIFESLWVKRILTLDVHSPIAIQNSYSIPVDLLEAKNLFAHHCRYLIEKRNVNEVVVLSPDSGGLERARRFRRSLASLVHAKVSIACMDKEHEGLQIKGYNIISDEPIRGKSVIVYDDMISSAKTNLECIEACRRCDAKEVLASCASHGLFVGKANEYLDHPFLKNIVVTDTIKPFRLTNSDVTDKLSVIKTTSLLAEAIKRTHRGESISDLINNGCTAIDNLYHDIMSA
jgi:ribose-phosphate pyrophosphokinase